MPGKKWIKVTTWIAGALLFWAALPTIKNVVLYLGYHHGNETLDKVSGEPGTLVGIWEGTFDTMECGMDERYVLSLEVRPDSTGVFRYRFLNQRYVVGGASLYGWGALWPHDPSQARWYEAPFQLQGAYVVIDPEPLPFVYGDTLVALLHLEDDHVRFAYVDSVGAEPEEWGLTFGQLKAKPKDLIAFWNLTGKEPWE